MYRLPRHRPSLLPIGLAAAALIAAACGGGPAPASGLGFPGGSGAPRPTIGTLRGPVATGALAPTFGVSGVRPVGSAPPAIGGQVAPAGHTLRLTPQVVFDPASGNVAALTFLVPEGWQAQGGIQWMPEWERLANLTTTISDPRSGLAIEWLPLQDFIWFDAPAGLSAPVGGNYQGKAYVPPISDPSQFVTQFWLPTALADLQGATLAGGNEVPVIAQEFLRGFGGPGQAHAWRLRYTYQRGGQPWEADVNFALLYSGSQQLTSWYVNFAYVVRGPAGTIDANAGLISSVVSSRTTTPEWEANYRLVQRLFTQGIQQQMADTQAFGQLLAQYRAESQQLQAEVTAERQASQDRIADLRGQSLQGIDTYVNPIDRTLVQLPQGWVEYWVNPKGEYLTTDTPGFDPNQADNEGWQRLTLRQ